MIIPGHPTLAILIISTRAASAGATSATTAGSAGRMAVSPPLMRNTGGSVSSLGGLLVAASTGVTRRERLNLPGLLHGWGAVAVRRGDDVRVTDEVLADQVGYYRRRASEYDVPA
ncbi:hypothetical protein [Phytohabitans kaempferiae]|uniref:Uncharacterized protein n=1 Tax=Phytohabitans kaempferiae TaxID=1620943 RepID=A0ABV6MGV2_9ACTN